MIGVLADNLLLTLFIVIALGAAFGAIPFGPVKFGAAGALFIGLLVGAFVPASDAALTTFQDLGLGLFVYMVGLEAGETFLKEVRQQFGLMLGSILSVSLGALAAVVVGGLLDLSREISVGVFAGSLTSTPSLALAQEQSGSEIPAVGYSLGYPTGLVMAIVVLALVMGRSWAAKKDQVSADDAVLLSAMVRVEHAVAMSALRERFGDHVRLATLRRGSHTLIPDSDEMLEIGDVVTLFVTKSSAKEVVKAIGRRLPFRPPSTRQVTVRRFTLSNSEIACNTIG